MRDLTIKQKNLLKKWFKESEPTREGRLLLNQSNKLRSVEDLSTEQYETLQEINDTEVLYQNVNNFIDELRNSD